MSEISKITLPNGKEYDLKDTTARATGKVSGVKGAAESSYRAGNVNLTAENIGAYERKNYEKEGTLDVGVRPLVNLTRANRLVFLPASQIIIEKTIDGGVTWEDAGYTDSQKISLFSENNNYQINIPLLNGKKSTLCGLRVIITGMDYDVPSGTAETEKYAYWNKDHVISKERYFNVREWWFWLNSNVDMIKPSIYCATGANPNNWINVFTADFGMDGQSGSDWIRAGDGRLFGGSRHHPENYWNWKLEFYSRPTDSNITSGIFNSNAIQSIFQIRCYGDGIWDPGNGGNLANKDHLYSWDNNKNASFPAAITATSFNGSLNGNAATATNANKVNNHTVNSDVPANAKFTDTVTTVTTTGSGNAVTAISASNGSLTATKGATFATKQESSNHVIASKTQPSNQQAGDIWIIIK